ncbi:MAG: FadR/GntR family transcriptional regulator [Alphaproteobacteria bacterium]|nr:FadR/GntR family transcriptional regulator [Alphaproteobacteria bacterium]
MPFESVLAFRLYQKVADQIEGMIRSGELVAGERLPSERELAARLGVSRPTVREAMIALEIAGLVEVRTGSGVYVLQRRQKPAGGFSVLRDIGAGPLELIDARLIIEPAIAKCAAQRVTTPQLEAITAAVNAMKAAGDSVAHRKADEAFHTAIAAACGNGVLVSIVQEMWREMFSPLFERMGHLTGLVPDRHSDTTDEHTAIYDALIRRDAEAAEAAMRDHLTSVRVILLETTMGREESARAATPVGDDSDVA